VGVPRARLLADAGMAVGYVLRLALYQPRITRVYLYQWAADETVPSDSAAWRPTGGYGRRSGGGGVASPRLAAGARARAPAEHDRAGAGERPAISG
jgi:hypothetical protein